MPPLDHKEIIQFEESLHLNLKCSDERRSWEKRSIYRVHTGITDFNKKAYQLQVVSFGPYHHGKDHLLPMEEHKHRALRHFINRFGKRLEDLFESMSEVADDIKESYDELDLEDKVGSSVGTASRFVMMMITDGCFMLEILRTPTLENQVPMLVLDRLVALRDGQKEDKFISHLILQFCSRSMDNVENASKEKCLHVLDVFRKNMLMEPKKKDKKDIKDGEGIIRSATEGTFGNHSRLRNSFF